MGAVRVLLWGVTLLLVLAVGTYLLRLPIAGMAVRMAMARAGLETPQAEVISLSPEQLTLRRVAAGPAGREGFQFEEIAVDFDWRETLETRSVRSVRIGPGVVRAEISASGEISLPGFRFARGQSAEQPPELPFEALSLDDVSLVLQTPEGRAEGKVEGSYEAGAGGAARIHLASARAGTSAVLIEDGRVTLDAVIGPDDALTISGDMTAAVQAFAGRIRDLVVSVDGKVDSWRAPETGGAIVDLQSAIADVAAIPVLSAMDAERLASIFGGPVSAIEASGRFNIEFVEGRVAASLADQPLELRADTGARFVITENEEVSFLSKSGDEASASFSFSLEDAPLTAGGYVDAEQRDGAWFVNVPLQVDAFRSPVVAFDNASSVVRMTASDAGVDADITATFALTELNIGRFSVSDAPISARFLASAERNAKTIVVSSPDGECLRLARAKLSIDQQDTEASLRDARLCADNGRYIAIDWENDFESRFGGFLSADNLRYRLGQTRIAGQAPLIRFEGVYQPLQHLTRASGDISDGQVTLNDVLVFSSADGNFQFSLDSRIMRASADLNSVRVSQRASAPWVAPVVGAGQARLEGRMIDFDYILRTPGGRNLGAGTGVHNVSDAQGESRFTLDGLTFEDTALQPDLLAPALRGIIGRTTGAVGGDMRFAWAPGPGGLKSSGEFILENVTFGGPTRVVTQTRGVNGRLAFASLWPLRTDGEQSVSVSGVDFGALQLDEGEIRFAMPGDETLRIIEAEFPWFGGVLGVYEANASMADGAATAPLRADDIDLSQVLDYFDVDGLSGEGVLSGVLPLVVEDAKASIVDGVLQSEGPGAIRYVGQAGSEAAAAGDNAQIAFDLLRDLRYSDLNIAIDGPLDGRLQFQMRFEGTGEVALNQQNVRVPVIYRINLDAALLELLSQANLSRDFQLQIQQGLQDAQ